MDWVFYSIECDEGWRVVKEGFESLETFQNGSWVECWCRD